MIDKILAGIGNLTKDIRVSDAVQAKINDIIKMLELVGINQVTLKQIKNGAQLGITYKGTEFHIRLYNNKLKGVTVDLSQVKNDGVKDDLTQIFSGNFDTSTLDSPLYISDDSKKVLIGSDESGKGDLFGGICVTAVAIHPDLLDKVESMFNIKDSKELSDDEIIETIHHLNKFLDPHDVSIWNPTFHDIRDESDVVVTVFKYPELGIIASFMDVPPEIFNSHYTNPEIGDSNTNKLLVEYHTECILCGLFALDVGDGIPTDSNIVLIDQFGNSSLFDDLVSTIDEDYNGKGIIVEQRPRAESVSSSVALASMFSRYNYLNQLRDLSLNLGVPELPLGCGDRTKRFYEKYKTQLDKLGLENLIKLNFNV